MRTGDTDGSRGNKDRIIVNADTHGATVDIEILRSYEALKREDIKVQTMDD